MRQQTKGSVALVALCFVAVLGIALASYLSVSNQSMKLSNRSFQTGLSEQLAEMGLERALQAFNSNDWSAWDTSTPNTAKLTITFPNTKYGASGVIGSINLRVDNYNIASLSSNWSNSKSYVIGDLVGSNGIWYRCVQPHNLAQTPATAQTPLNNLAYWVPEPIGWKFNSGGSYTYKLGEVVNYSGSWYYCSAATTTTPSLLNPSWINIPHIYQSFSSAQDYVANDVIYDYAQFPDGFWHICTTPGVGASAAWGIAPISWSWNNATAYAFDDMVYIQGVWYRCIQANTNVAPSGGPFSSLFWAPALTMWSWSSIAAYNLNAVVYYGGNWYRCIQANTGQSPPNSAYWSNAPALSYTWDATKTYSVADVVTYGGTWYRCTTAHSIPQIPPNVSYWASASTSTWSTATAYNAGDTVSYGGVWYSCIAANTNISPNNATYWTTQAPIIYAQGVVTLPDFLFDTIKTQIRAVVSTAPLFPNAAAATSVLNLSSGTNGLVDSYDSNAGPYSAPGGYSAVLAGGSSVTVTNATVQGYVAAPSSSSSPYAPMATFGTSTVVEGSASGLGVDTSRVSRSPYIPQFSIQTVVSNTALPISSGNTNVGTPGATTPSVYYVPGGLTLTTGYTLTIKGPVVIDVNPGSLNINGGTITILKDTGSAEIHFTDRLRIRPTGGLIDNQTLDPKKLILLGTSASSAGNTYAATAVTPFYGVIYMPNATGAIDFSSTSSAIYGAVSAQYVTFSAQAALHFDTSLRSATISGVDAPYTIIESRELVDSTERVVLP